MNVAGFTFTCYAKKEVPIECAIESPLLNLNKQSCLLISLAYNSCPSDVGRILLNTFDRLNPIDRSEPMSVSRSKRKQHFQANLKETTNLFIISTFSKVGTFLLHRIHIKGEMCVPRGRQHSFYF